MAERPGGCIPKDVARYEKVDHSYDPEDDLIFDYLAAVERGDMQGRVNIRVAVRCLLGKGARFEDATSRYRQEDAAFVRAKYVERVRPSSG